MNSPSEYPKSRPFARLVRVLAEIYVNPVEFQKQVSAHAEMFLALGRSPQGFAVANQTMIDLTHYYMDRRHRPHYWLLLEDGLSRKRSHSRLQLQSSMAASASS